MHHTAKQRPADHPRSLAMPFCGISAVARDVVQRQPGHSMHPSQGSQSCAALFRLSCLVLVYLALSKRLLLRGPCIEILKPFCIRAACVLEFFWDAPGTFLYEGLVTSF